MFMRKSIKTLLQKEILTIAEYAKLRGVAPGTVKTEVVRGTLKGVKKGKTWLLDIQDLKDKLEARQ